MIPENEASNTPDTTEDVAAGVSLTDHPTESIEEERVADTCPEIPVVDETYPGAANDGVMIQFLHKRVTLLEDAFKKHMETVDKLASGMSQAQQVSNALIGLVNQLSMRVNGLDPNVAVLEVTLLDAEPTIDDSNKEKEVALKVTVHNKSHPEKPELLDVLRLDKSNPEEPHWVPAGVTPILSSNIMEQLKEAGVPEEQWQWVLVREIPREHGQTALVITGPRPSVEVTK